MLIVSLEIVETRLAAVAVFSLYVLLQGKEQQQDETTQLPAIAAINANDSNISIDSSIANEGTFI